MDELEWNEEWWAEWMQGPDAEALMYRAGYLAEALFLAAVPVESGQLAESTAVDVEITKPYPGRSNPRYTATLRVTAPYAAAFEFGFKAKNGKEVPGHHLLAQVIEALSI